jgi:hypothetical protein
MIQRPTEEPVIAKFNGVKVFSATMAQDREALGNKITAWIQSNPHKQIVHTIVTQSSDDAFHCLAITVFFSETGEASTAAK